MDSCVFIFRFSDLTGVDYSEDAINLAQSLANRDGFSCIKFLVMNISVQILTYFIYNPERKEHSTFDLYQIGYYISNEFCPLK